MFLPQFLLAPSPRARAIDHTHSRAHRPDMFDNLKWALKKGEEKLDTFCFLFHCFYFFSLHLAKNTDTFFTSVVIETIGNARTIFNVELCIS